MLKKKIGTYLLIAFVFFLFSSIAVVAIIVSRGGTVTDQGIVLDSGVLRVQTDPANIKVKFYINDKEVFPVESRINGLLEGEYTLRIESEGYTTWEKSIKVTSGLVSDIYAKLYPLNFTLAQLTKTNIDRAFFSSNGEFVYYVVKDSEFGSDKGIWRLRLAQNQSIFNTSPNTPVKIADLDQSLFGVINNGKYQLLPSLDNNSLLFFDNETGLIFVLNAAGFNQAPFNEITAELGFKPEKVAWFNNSSSLLVKDNLLLYEYNLTNKTSTLVYYAKDSGPIYAAVNSTIFVFDQNQKQLKRYINQKLEPVELVNVTLPVNISEIYTTVNNARFLIVKSDEKYYYLDLEKSLIKEIGSGFNFLEFSQDGRSALFLQDKKVITYNVTEIIATNSVETKLSETTLMVTSPNDVIKFVPQSSHIIHYANSDLHRITIAEKDGANEITLLDNAGIKNSDFSFDSDANSFVVLLYDELNKETNQTSKANLYTIDLEKPKS